MPRIIQISDTHLSAHHGFFVENFARVIAAVAEESPHLVVNSGDLSINGAEDDADLRYAAACHARIAAPVAIIPGNHDIGEEPGALHMDQPISGARIARYKAVFRTDRFARDVGAWRILGINSLLIASGLDEEGEQFDWFADALASAKGRPIGLFLHKPFWIESADEAPQPEWTVDPQAREAYLDLIEAAGVRFVASGHLHQRRQRDFGGVRHVWGPSTAFPSNTDLPGGERVLGYTVFDLESDGAFTARFAAPDLVRHDYDALKENGRYPFLKDVPAFAPPEGWA